MNKPYRYALTEPFYLEAEDGAILIFDQDTPFNLETFETRAASGFAGVQSHGQRYQVPTAVAREMQRRGIPEVVNLEPYPSRVFEVSLSVKSAQTLAKKLEKRMADWKADPRLVEWLRNLAYCARERRDPAAQFAALSTRADEFPEYLLPQKTENTETACAIKGLVEDSAPALFRAAIANISRPCRDLGAFDFDQFAMHVGDAADHLDLALALLAGNTQRIARLAQMDTAPREAIPKEAWAQVCAVL